MCCGIVGDTLMVRVGAEAYEEYLNKEHVREMNFTGKAMKAMVYVSPDGIESDHNLHQRIGICESFINTLPAKKKKHTEAVI